MVWVHVVVKIKSHIFTPTNEDKTLKDLNIFNKNGCNDHIHSQSICEKYKGPCRTYVDW